MTKDLQQKIYDRWPKWFNANGPIQHTLIPFGLECGDGWFQIIWDLCERIEATLGNASFEVIQVKEKFGGLRFYTEGGGEVFRTIGQLIGEAEDRSFKTCEVCGQPGEVRDGGWIKTLCDVHDNGGKAIKPIQNAQDLAVALKQPENQEVLDQVTEVIKREKQA